MESIHRAWFGTLTQETLEQVADVMRSILSVGSFTSAHVYDGQLSATDVRPCQKLRALSVARDQILIQDTYGLTIVGLGAWIHFEGCRFTIHDAAFAGTKIQRVYVQDGRQP